MAVKGVFASDQNIPGTERGDFASAILMTEPTGSAPLLALTSGMEKAGASSTVIHWFEENHISGRVSMVSNAGTGTGMTVDDASALIAGVVMMVETTGEYIFINSIAGNVLTVTRGLAGTTVTSIDGSTTAVPLQRISTAFEEGSSRPTSVANLGAPRFNYMQIFRNGWDVTGTARVVDYYTGDVVAKNKRDAATFHSEDIERAIIFGKKAIGVQNSQPFRLMDGVIAQLAADRIFAQTTNMTWTKVDSFLQTIFEKNIKGKPNERIAFCGNTVVSVLNQIARLDGVVNIAPGQTDFGMKIMQWMTPYGNISLMTHPLFNESPLWTKNLLVLHPGAMRTRWLRNTFEDNYDRDGSRAGVDADYGVITSEMCVEYAAGLTGGYYTGIDTAAAS